MATRPRAPGAALLSGAGHLTQRHDPHVARRRVSGKRPAETHRLSQAHWGAVCGGFGWSVWLGGGGVGWPTRLADAPDDVPADPPSLEGGSALPDPVAAGRSRALSGMSDDPRHQQAEASIGGRARSERCMQLARLDSSRHRRRSGVLPLERPKVRRTLVEVLEDERDRDARCAIEEVERFVAGVRRSPAKGDASATASPGR